MPDEAFPKAIGFDVCWCIFFIMVVYVWHKGTKISFTVHRPITPILNAVRLEYFQVFFWGITGLCIPALLIPFLGIPGLEIDGPGEHWVCQMGAHAVGQAALLAGIAHASDSGSKTLLEFGTVRRIAQWYYILSLWAPSWLAADESGLNKYYCAMLYEMVNLSNVLQAVYPCGFRRWVCRVSYMVYGFSAFLFIVQPSLAVTVWQIRDQGAASALMGCNQLLICFAYAAVAQTDHHCQKKALEYSLVAHVFVLIIAAYGWPAGLFPWVSFALLVATVGDVYFEHAKITYGNVLSFKSRPAMSSMKRGRGRTPGSK